MKKIFTLCIIVLFIITNTNSQPVSGNDSLVSAAMELISQDSIEKQLQWLQDMGTRFLMATNHKDVSLRIKERFESYGMTEVRLDSFECYTNIDYSILHYDTTTWQYNVEARITGSLYPDVEILVMGHHDDVQLNSNPEYFAPGADDNASGTVAVLETARVLMAMGYQPEMTLVFLTTAAEELMYFGDAGSEHYAAEAAAAGRNLWAVINNDMIAYDNGSDVIGFSNLVGSEEITGIAAMITENYTNLSANIPAPHHTTGADLQPFLDEGYSGLYLMEDVFNPFYHTDQDLVVNCDLEYLTEVIKISLGSMIYSDISLGIGDPELGNIDFSIWPNPCTDILNIMLDGHHGEMDVFLYNTLGQTIQAMQVQHAKKPVRMDISGLPDGVYFVKVVVSGAGKSVKLIKQ